MSGHEIEQFLSTWEYESELTARLLKTVPKDQYDFRPDPEGRSMGELAWHMAELEGFMSTIAAEHSSSAVARICRALSGVRVNYRLLLPPRRPLRTLRR